MKSLLVLSACVAYTLAQAKGTVKCHQCSSSNKGQSDCDDSEKVTTKFISPCKTLTDGSFKQKSAIGCRKILQNVGDEYTVIRECAYSGEDIHGQRKTGNSGIVLFYYQCTNTDNLQNKPCNGASSTSLFLASLVATISLYLAQ